MELEQLSFRVDTSSLEAALQKVQALERAIAKMSSEMGKLAENRGSEAKASAEELRLKEKLQESTDKLAKAEARLNEAKANAAKASKDKASADNSLAQAESEVQEKLSAVERRLEQQRIQMQVLAGDTIEFSNAVLQLGRSFTSGQASQLASLKLLGATSEQFKSLAQGFEQLNSITGVNPFDKSASGLNKMKKEAAELSAVNALMSEGLGLTKEQIIGLSRDIEALTLVANKAGLSQAQLSQKVQELKQNSAAAAAELNALRAAAEQSEKAAKAGAKASISASGYGDQASAFSAYIKEREALLQAERLSTQSSMQQMREYYMQQQAQDEEAARKRKASFDYMVQVHTWKKEQEASVYKAEMQQMREYYSQMQQVNDDVARAQQAVSDRIRRDQLTQAYLQQGASRSTANLAAGFEMRGVDKTVIDSFVQEATAKEAAAKASRDLLSANQYLRDLEQRLSEAVSETNTRLNKQATDELVKLRQALAMSGKSAAEAEADFQRLSKMIAQVSDKEQSARFEHAARNFSMQMGDVAVSLASGMNPLTVAIQQGDQMRVALQGVAGSAEETKEIMRKAVAQMVASWKLVGAAVWEFSAGAVESLGKSAIGWVKNIAVMQSAREALVQMQGEGSTLVRIFDKLGVASTYAAGALTLVSGVGVVAVLSAVAIGALQAWKEIDKLAVSMAQYGAASGMTLESSTAVVSSLQRVGVSSKESSEAIALLAKEGSFTAAQFYIVAQAAAEMQRWVGVSIEDTVKQFAKIKDDPVAAVIELAQKTGMLDMQTIRYIETLKLQGKEQEAVQAAMQAFGDVHARTVEKAKADLSGLAVFWKTLSKEISDFMDTVGKRMWYNPTLDQQIKDIETQIAHAGKVGFGGADFSSGSNTKELKEQLEVLKEQKRLYEANAQAQAGVAKQEAEALQANKAAQKLREQGYNDETRHLSKLRELKALIDKSTGEDTSVLQAAYNEEVKKYEEKLSRAAARKTPEQKEAERLQRYYDGLIDRARALNNEAKGYAETQTKAETALKNAMDDTQWAKLSKSRKEAVQQEFMIAAEAERTNKVRDIANKLLGRAVGLGDEFYKTQIDLANLYNSGRSGWSPEEYERLTKALYDTTEQGKAWLRITAELQKYSATVEITRAEIDDQRVSIGKTVVQQEIEATAIAKKLELLKAEKEYKEKIAAIEQSQMSEGQKMLAGQGAESVYRRAVETIEVKYDNKAMTQFSDDWRLLIEQISNFSTSLTGAFGSVGTNIGAAVQSFSKLAATVEQNQRVLSKYQEGTDEYNKQQKKNTADELALYASSAGAIAGMFDKRSSAYKAFHAIEQGIHIARLAMMAAEMAQQVTSVATTVSTNAAKMASNVTAAGTAGVAAVISSLVGPFPANIAAAAAVSAIVAGLLGSIGGSFSGGSSKAPTYNTGTGTSFGDPSKASESLSDVKTLLEKSNILTEKYSPQMVGYLRNISNNIGGLVNLMIRTGNIDTSLTGNTKTTQNYSALNTITNLAATGVAGLLGNKLGSVGGSLVNALLFGAMGLNPLIGGAIGLLSKPISNLIGSIFGKTKTTVTGQGLTGDAQSLGDILASGYNAQYFTDVKIKKSGLFGGSTKYRTYTTDADDQTNQQITAVFEGVYNSVLTAGKMLGGAEKNIIDGLNSYVIDIGKIKLTGTAEEMQKTLTNVFSGISDSIAKTIIPGFEQFQKVGEGYFETVVRVATDLEKVNSYISLLGGTVLQLGVSGVEASQDLVSLFGSIDDLSTALSNFYDKFTTDEQKQADRLSQLRSVFSSLGLSLPSSLTAYKSLVASLDLSTSSGREAYYALISVSDAFYEMKSKADELAKTTRSNLYDAFKSAYDTEKARLSDLQSTYQDAVDNLTSIFDNLSSYIKELRGVSSSAMSLAEARKVISSAISTGVVPDSSTLSAAYNTIKSNLDSTSFASAVDKKRAYALQANQLEALQGLVGTQRSAQQLLLDNATKQLNSLENVAKWAEKSYNALEGSKTTEYGIKEAINSLNKLFVEQARANGISLTPVPAYATGGSYRGGLAMVGEDGPELIDFSSPGRISNNQQTKDILRSSGEGLEGKVQNLAEALDMLRYEVRAGVSHSSDLLKIIKRVTPSGDSLLVQVQ